MDTETIVTRHRADLLRQLVELARDRKRADKLLEDLNQVDKVIATLNINQKYAKYEKIYEAWEAVLRESGHPWDIEELIAELHRGGFRTGDPGLEGNIRRSIQSHISGDGVRRLPLKKVNGLVGLKEWPNKLFQNEKAGD